MLRGALAPSAGRQRAAALPPHALHTLPPPPCPTQLLGCAPPHPGPPARTRQRRVAREWEAGGPRSDRRGKLAARAAGARGTQGRHAVRAAQSPCGSPAHQAWWRGGGGYLGDRPGCVGEGCRERRVEGPEGGKGGAGGPQAQHGGARRGAPPSPASAAVPPRQGRRQQGARNAHTGCPWPPAPRSTTSHVGPRRLGNTPVPEASADQPLLRLGAVAAATVPLLLTPPAAAAAELGTTEELGLAPWPHAGAARVARGARRSIRHSTVASISGSHTVAPLCEP